MININCIWRLPLWYHSGPFITHHVARTFIGFCDKLRWFACFFKVFFKSKLLSLNGNLDICIIYDRLREETITKSIRKPCNMKYFVFIIQCVNPYPLNLGCGHHGFTWDTSLHYGWSGWCFYETHFMRILNTLRPRQNGRRFADDTFKRIFLNENAIISIKISLNVVPKGPINNNQHWFR